MGSPPPASRFLQKHPHKRVRTARTTSIRRTSAPYRGLYLTNKRRWAAHDLLATTYGSFCRISTRETG
eukprot:scaffold257153_cov14-Tisochrysis_lutea.AAC.1